jgi:drug/metabolite transporter superfamily protein YnfA
MPSSFVVLDGKESGSLPFNRPDFRPPTQRFVTTGIYSNPVTNQQFRVTVNSFSDALLARYLDTLQLYLEVVPNRELRVPTILEQRPDEGSTTPNEGSESEPEETNSIQIEVLDTQGIAPPYVLQFVIDPTISEDVGGIYKDVYHFSGSNAVVTIEVGNNSLYAKYSTRGREGPFSRVYTTGGGVAVITGLQLSIWLASGSSSSYNITGEVSLAQDDITGEVSLA